MYRCYCDYCGREIIGSMITVEFRNLTINDKDYGYKHFHPDCFNYLYSTDYKRIEGVRV